MSIVSKANIKNPVKHVIRQLAAITSPAGYMSPQDLDADISSLVLQGYKIIDTHFLGKQVDPAANIEYYGILYVMVLEQTEVERLKKQITNNLESGANTSKE